MKTDRFNLGVICQNHTFSFPLPTKTMGPYFPWSSLYCLFGGLFTVPVNSECTFPFEDNGELFFACRPAASGGTECRANGRNIPCSTYGLPYYKQLIQYSFCQTDTDISAHDTTTLCHTLSGL